MRSEIVDVRDLTKADIFMFSLMSTSILAMNPKLSERDEKLHEDGVLFYSRMRLYSCIAASVIMLASIIWFLIEACFHAKNNK